MWPTSPVMWNSGATPSRRRPPQPDPVAVGLRVEGHVAVGVHRALRRSRRAGRVGQERDVVGRELDGSGCSPAWRSVSSSRSCAPDGARALGVSRAGTSPSRKSSSEVVITVHGAASTTSATGYSDSRRRAPGRRSRRAAPQLAALYIGLADTDNRARLPGRDHRDQELRHVLQLRGPGRRRPPPAPEPERKAVAARRSTSRPSGWCRSTRPRRAAMEAADRRPLLVSKGWVQAVLLVILFGFFVLGLLAYRTYQAKPPMPQRVVDPQGQVLYTAQDITAGQQVFLHNGLMEYGSVFGHGAYLGPDYTADYLRRVVGPRPALLRRCALGHAPRAGRSRTSAPTATTSGRGTLTLTRRQAAAHRRLVGHYSRFFSEPTTKHGLRPNAITDRDELAPAHRVLRVDGLGRLDRPPGPRLLLHEQLAAGAPRGQQADGERGGLERALADRAARRDRHPLRRLRPLALPRLARPRAGDAVVPRARRRRAHPGPARVRLVLLRHGRAVPAPDVRGRGVTALSRRDRRASSASISRRSSRTT